MSKIIKDKKEYIILAIIGILLPLYVFSPFLTNHNYVPCNDITETYPFVEKLREPSLFPNYLYAEKYLSFFHNSASFFYSISFLRAIFPMRYIYNFIVPVLLSLTIIFSLYGIGKTIKNKKAGLIVAIFGIIVMWPMRHLREGIGHSIGFALVFPFLYSLIAKKEKFTIIVLMLNAIFYPPMLVLLSMVYCLSKINWKKFRLIDANIDVPKLLIVFTLAGILMFLNFNFDTDLVSQKEAKTMPEFKPGGFIAAFYDNPIHGIFSESDDVEIFIDNADQFNPRITSFSVLLVLTLIFLGLNYKRMHFIKPIIKKTCLLPLSGLALYIFVFIFIYDVPIYIPSRYFEYSMVPFLIVLTGIGIYYALTKINFGWTLKIIVSMLVVLLIYKPILIPNENICEYNELYAFVKELPKDVLISSNPADRGMWCIPMLSGRKMIPMKVFTVTSSYFKQWNKFEREVNYDTFKAYYSDDAKEIIDYCEKYGITHIVFSNYTFSERYFNDKLYYKPYKGYIEKLIKDGDFFLKKMYNKGIMLDDGKVSVIECKDIEVS